MNPSTPRAVALAVCVALLCMATARAQAPAAPVEREGQRSDDRRPEAPFTVDLLGRAVQLTGSWEYSDEWRRNFDLDRTRERDRRVREHEVKLEARLGAGERTEVFVQAVGLYETRHTQGSGHRHEKSLERGQTWVRFDRLGGTPWALQVGRVALIERRAWWWDDDLDALRLTGSSGAWRVDTGLAREVARVSSALPGIAADQRGVWRWFGQASWRWAPRHALDLFWLRANDRSARPAAGSVANDEDATDASDLRATWTGVRASGEWRSGDEGGARLAYWLDTAALRGREALTDYTEQDDGSFTAGATAVRRVRGDAIDLGATWTSAWPLRPSLTLAFARGSGGERSTVLDANFRQTGLQENKARIAGVKRLRRYGELLQPELSNLAVGTVGTGVRMLRNSSLELIAHRYRQVAPSTALPGSRLGADPAGASRDIGREVDLALALREWPRAEFTLKWSRFKPGAAFDADQRDPARAFELGAAFNF